MKIGILKKVLVIGGVIGGMIMPIVSGNGAVFAEEDNSSCGKSYLGFVPWCNGVDYENVSSEDDLETIAIGIALNVLTDLTVAVSYLTLGWVIWGGYKYMFSRGDTGKTTEGKKTLTNAFIGLAIVMLSSVIFSAIRGVLGGSSTEYGGMTLGGADPGEIVTNSISWFMGMAGVVAVVFVVYGGISYITAAGDSGKIVKAKNVIIYSLIGLAIVILAEVITGFVAKGIRESTTSSSETSVIFNDETLGLMRESFMGVD